MSRREEIVKLTVVKTGTVYKADEVSGKDLKEVDVEIRVLEETGEELGTYQTHGWVDSGDVYYVVPTDRGNQLEASQKATQDAAPSEDDKARATKVLKK